MTSKLSHSGSYLVELLYVDESEVGVVAGHQEVVDVSRVGSLRKYAVAGPWAGGRGDRVFRAAGSTLAPSPAGSSNLSWTPPAQLARSS